MNQRFYQVLVFVLLTVVILFIFYSLKPIYLFNADSLIKLMQAHSLQYTGFQTDEIQCQAIYQLDDCRFLNDLITPFHGKRIAPFPVALSFVSGIGLVLAGPLSIPIMGCVLYFISLWIVHKTWKISPWILLLITLTTPLLINSLTFVDLAIANFFLVIGLFFLSITDRNLRAIPLLGFLAGLSVFFRVEFVFFYFFISLFYVWTHRTIDRKILLWGGGVALSVSLFFLMNWVLYSQILGPRVAANESGIFSNPWEKLQILNSLLFYGDLRFGFFGFTPFFLVSFGFLVFYRKSIMEDKNIQILSYSVFVSLLFVAVFSPNNSNIDWGSRYLGFTIFPFAILIDSSIKSLSDKSRKIFVVLAILISLFSLSVFQKYYKLVKDVSQKSETYISFYESLDADVWIFDNRYLLMIAGYKFLDKQILLVRNEKDARVLIEKYSSEFSNKKLNYIGFHPAIQVFVDSNQGNNEFTKLINPQAPKIDAVFRKNLQFNSKKEEEILINRNFSFE